MAHAKLHRQIMLDWIEDAISAGHPMPADAAICERFNFQSAEQARTLLAELADAGKITVRGGYGPGREILLGRVRPGALPIAKPEPSITRVDPEVDAATAKIMAIVGRGRSTSPALAAPTPPLPAASVAVPPVEKDPPMPNPADKKTISFVASGPVLEEIRRRTADGTSFNQAVQDLLADVMRASQPVASSGAVDLSALEAHALISELARRVTAGADPAELAAAEGRAKEAEARAEAAEARLASIRAAMGAA